VASVNDAGPWNLAEVGGERSDAITLDEKVANEWFGAADRVQGQ
jgi:hypothetical protein